MLEKAHQFLSVQFFLVTAPIALNAPSQGTLCGASMPHCVVHWYTAKDFALGLSPPMRLYAIKGLLIDRRITHILRLLCCNRTNINCQGKRGEREISEPRLDSRTPLGFAGDRQTGTGLGHIQNQLSP